MKRILVLAVVLAAMLCASAWADSGVYLLPEDLEIIENQAFYGADGLSEVVLPYGLKEIHSGAFANSSVTHLNIPSTVTYIADDAFSGCDIQQATVLAGSYAEEYCARMGFEYRLQTDESAFAIQDLGNGECEISGYTPGDTNVVIPEYIQGLRVVSIGKSAFYNCGELESVELPSGVVQIADDAFHWCWSLKSVDMPDSVTSIGARAFQFCQQLTSLELPAGLESLGAAAFNGSGLTSAAVPEGVTELPELVFSSCKQLTEVTLPEGITAIGEGAFSYSGIEYFAMPAGVTVLEESVFAGCYSLTEVVLSENLKTIGTSAFRGSDALLYADIPYSVTSIGDYAFDGCTGLQLVGLPGTIQTIGYSAFEGVENAFFVTERSCVALDYCKANYKLILLEPNAESDFTVKNLTSTTCQITGYSGSDVDVFLPDTIGGRTVTSIGASAFKGKTKIESVSVLNYVTSIGANAFNGCTSLSYMQITSDVTDIADTAFDGCTSLEQILVVELVEEAAEATADASAMADVAAAKRVTAVPLG